jgi:hypothetical protein
MWRYAFPLAALALCPLLSQAQSQPGPFPLQGPAAAQIAPLPGTQAMPGNAPATQPAAPAPAAHASAPVESLTTFDPRVTDVEWEGSHWRLVAGGVVLRDFGRQEADARDALRMVRELQLTQHATIGSPQPIMEYWLSNGRAPQGLISGLRVLPLDQRTLSVAQVQGQWCVRDAARTLFNFGSHEDEARQALSVIQHYGFTHVTFAGHAAVSMLVFLANSGSSALANEASTVLRPGRPAHHLSEVMPHHPLGSDPANNQATSPNEDPSTSHGPVGGTMNALGQRPSFKDFQAMAAASAVTPAGTQLAPPGVVGVVAGTDHIAVDWRQVQQRQDGRNWRLVQGERTLAEFGAHDSDARLAASVVQYYHFSEECLIGHPKPVFRYFLVNGQPPRGTLFGLENVSFHPEELSVREVGGRWVLGDHRRTICDFGDKAEEARTALEVIRHYQFDTLCHVGHGGADGLSFPVRSH